MFKQQMSEYKEKGSVEKPIVSDDELRERSFSEISVEKVEIEDSEGDEKLKVRKSCDPSWDHHVIGLGVPKRH